MKQGRRYIRKKIITVCLAVMLACPLWLAKDRWSLPAAQKTEHGGLRVGLFQAEPLASWKTAQIRSFKEAARGRGAQLICHTSEEESLERQIKDICGFPDSDTDYFILIPGARNGYDQVLLEAEQRGVPMILVEQDVEMEPEYDREDYMLGYVASDYYAERELCTDILVRHFGIEPCHTIVIQGEKSSAMDQEWYMGFTHGVREYSNLYVFECVENNGNRLTAQKVTEPIIAGQGTDFNTVFTQSDEDGPGVLQTLKSARMEPGKDVVVVSIDGIQDVFKAIVAREYLATVKSSPEYGGVVLDIINRYQRGEKPD